MGRPSIFTPELGEAICHRIACGESLRSICRDDDMPGKSTVMRWLSDKDKAEFLAQMDAARDLQADDFVDEQNELSRQLPERHPQHGGYDAAHVAHIRNRISTLQWMAEKMKPKKYGNKTALEHSGSIDLGLAERLRKAKERIERPKG